MTTYSTTGMVTFPPRPVSTSEAVRSFLASIDPGELAEAALQYAGGLGGPTVGESFLLALQAMAEDGDGA